MGTKKKKFSEPSLLFNTAEWKEVVNCLWDSMEEKMKKKQQSLEQPVVNTLEIVKAQKKSDCCSH